MVTNNKELMVLRVDVASPDVATDATVDTIRLLPAWEPYHPISRNLAAVAMLIPS